MAGQRGHQPHKGARGSAERLGGGGCVVHVGPNVAGSAQHARDYTSAPDFNRPPLPLRACATLTRSLCWVGTAGRATWSSLAAVLQPPCASQPARFSTHQLTSPPHGPGRAGGPPSRGLMRRAGQGPLGPPTCLPSSGRTPPSRPRQPQVRVAGQLAAALFVACSLRCCIDNGCCVAQETCDQREKEALQAEVRGGETARAPSYEGAHTGACPSSPLGRHRAVQAGRRRTAGLATP